MSEKSGKKYLDKSGLNYVWQHIQNDILFEAGSGSDSVQVRGGNAEGDLSFSEGLVDDMQKIIEIRPLTAEEQTAIYNKFGLNFEYICEDYKITENDQPNAIFCGDLHTISPEGELSILVSTITQSKYILINPNADDVKWLGSLNISGITVDGLDITTNPLVFNCSNTIEEGSYVLVHSTGTKENALAGHSEGILTTVAGIGGHAEGVNSYSDGNGSHVEGIMNMTDYVSSHAEGAGNAAFGFVTHAEGINTTAVGDYSHTEGILTITKGKASHAEGNHTTANGNYSHTEGESTTTQGQASHAEGSGSIGIGVGSHAEGNHTTAEGSYSHAEGNITNAIGIFSHAEGYKTTAQGQASHAEGSNTKSEGDSSHAEGQSTIAGGVASHAEGYGSYIGEYAENTWTSGYANASEDTSLLNYAHAEGNGNIAVGCASHAEGKKNLAKGNYSHVEGNVTVALGTASHAEGSVTTATGAYSHVEGKENTATGTASHAEGSKTESIGNQSHAEGYQTTAKGLYTHAEGHSSYAEGQASHAEGYSFAKGDYSHSEGYDTQANYIYSHAEGYATQALNECAHAEGRKTTASGYRSHAEGNETTASAAEAHAEGYQTTASGIYSHAEGQKSQATQNAAHAEGFDCKATAVYSHAEGRKTTASGYRSHAEGNETTASAAEAHAEGYQTTASGDRSHAEGFQSKATASYSHAEGHSSSASGQASHAEGYSYANGGYSHTEGYNCRTGNYSDNSISSGSLTAKGSYAHAEGNASIASGVSSHAEGRKTLSIGEASHAEGFQTITNGVYSHTEGRKTQAYSSYSHAEGNTTKTYGTGAHAEGAGNIGDTTCSIVLDETVTNAYKYYITSITDENNYLNNGAVIEYQGVYYAITSIVLYENSNELGYIGEFTSDKKITNVGSTAVSVNITTGIAYGDYSHVEGLYASATGDGAHAEGNGTKASGHQSHAEGGYTVASGEVSHAEGNQTTASGNYSHTEGYKTTASGVASHAEGNETAASGYEAHAEGYQTTASGGRSHTEGTQTTASGTTSHAEGSYTTASGDYSHAEGSYTTASGEVSHAEGEGSIASGYISHAEGQSTIASGDYSHTEGYKTTTTGQSSHAEGNGVEAVGEASHAEGWHNIDSENNLIYTVRPDDKDNTKYIIVSDHQGTDGGEDGIFYLKHGMTFLYNNKYYYVTDVFYEDGSNIKPIAFKLNKTIYRLDTEDFNIKLVLGKSIGTGSHIEGNNTIAYGEYSHAEGNSTRAIGNNSHTEGRETSSIGENSHAEGNGSKSIGPNSHAEGQLTKTNSSAAHAEGINTVATNEAEHAEGVYNMSNLKEEIVINNNNHNYIDLGLPSGLLWATCNVGASSPEENGLYFDWGNVDGYDVDESGNVSDGYSFDETTYASTPGGTFTGSILDAEHDAASVKMGGNWRMPTIDEINELINNTTKTVDELNGISGIRFTATNGNSIFIPLAGFCNGTILSNADVAGGIRINEILSDYTTIAYNLLIDDKSKCNVDTSLRYIGIPVRGVITPTTITFGTRSSIGIGTSDTERKNAFEVMQNGDTYLIGVGDYDGTNAIVANSEGKKGKSLQESLQEYIKENELPQKENELIYFDENKGFVSNQLLLQDDTIIIDNLEDYNSCTKLSDVETDVLGSWQQFTDEDTYSPEYGLGQYINSSYSYGYGRWYLYNSKILNPINSNDFNGYMIPFAKSSYSIESIIGTDVGNTTGDNIGFSIVNDKNAIPKHVETESGKKYYRNTLYDILESNATEDTPQRPSKSAWVCEDKINNNAYVFYIDSPTTYSQNESYPIIYTEENKYEYDVYFIDNIKTSAGRKKYKVSDLTEDNSVFTEKIITNIEASGVIDFVTITVTNSSSMQIGHGTNTDNTGTIYVYGSRYNISSSTWTNQLVFSGNEGDLGRLLVAFKSDLDTNNSHLDEETGTYIYKPCVIKTSTDFNNGILTVEFSDATSDIENSKSVSYNGSELKIDFNNRKYFITPRNDYEDKTVVERDLPVGSSIDDDFWIGFTQETKFMYHAYSYQNLYIECLNILMDNRVIWVHNNGVNTIYGLNSERNGYENKGNIITKDILSGSRLVYNPITKKLFYSNGDIIYQIASSSGDNSSGDSGSDSGDNSSGNTGSDSSQSFTLNPATAVSLGGIKVGPNLSITTDGVLKAKGYTWDETTSTMSITGKIDATEGFYETSDARKKDIHGELPLDKAYDFIRNCEPILYSLKGSDKTQIGLIAQEVREFFPEIVNEDEEGYLSLDYAKLTVIMLRVLKDLIDKK